MVDFVSIFLIFLEVFLTVFVIKKILLFEKRIAAYKNQLESYHKPLIDMIKRSRYALKKVNNVFAFVTNKKFIRIKQILTICFQIAQIVILIKSLNFKKSLKFNPNALKRLVFVQVFKKAFEKIIFILKTCCV